MNNKAMRFMMMMMMMMIMTARESFQPLKGAKTTFNHCDHYQGDDDDQDSP